MPAVAHSGCSRGRGDKNTERYQLYVVGHPRRHFIIFELPPPDRVHQGAPSSDKEHGNTFSSAATVKISSDTTSLFKNNSEFSGLSETWGSCMEPFYFEAPQMYYEL